MAGNKLRIEVLVAYPPTDKCKALLSLAREIVAADSRLRLDVYESGSSLCVKPTDGWMKPPPKADHGKFKRIPCVYVNGMPLVSGEVPTAEAFRQIVAEQLGEPWQD